MVDIAMKCNEQLFFIEEPGRLWRGELLYTLILSFIVLFINQLWVIAYGQRNLYCYHYSNGYIIIEILINLQK